jgi:flagellar protein FlbT
MMAAFSNEEVLNGLRSLDKLVANARYYDALKTLRALFPVEDAILGRTQQKRFTEDTDNREVA